MKTERRCTCRAHWPALRHAVPVHMWWFWDQTVVEISTTCVTRTRAQVWLARSRAGMRSGYLLTNAFTKISKTQTTTCKLIYKENCNARKYNGIDERQ